MLIRIKDQKIHKSKVNLIKLRLTILMQIWNIYMSVDGNWYNGISLSESECHRYVFVEGIALHNHQIRYFLSLLVINW